jgi:ElaB/YqjD/DUF883 family membrane-anchored ribosome-binding protein
LDDAVLINFVKRHQIAAGRQMRDHEAELNELRRSIQTAIHDGLSDVAEAADSILANVLSNITALESLLRKFGDQLAEAAEEAEDTVVSHPLSSVGDGAAWRSREDSNLRPSV